MPEPLPQKPALPADDDLDELPPMDGADDEAGVDEDDEIDDVDDEGDPLDDATGEADPVDASEIDAHGGESGWLVDADDAEALDVGTSELASFEESGAHDPKLDFEEPGVGDEDFGLGADDGKPELDGGDEGPIAADEELREQDLPQLDADEEGEVEDAELIDVAFAEERAAIPRAAHPWESVGAPVDVGPVSAIACAGRGVVVATARGLARVDLEGACEALDAVGLGAPVVRLAVAGDAIAAVTASGELFVSRDGGATFKSSWRERASLSSGGVSDVVFADGALLARTRGGAVLRSTDVGVAWEIPTAPTAAFDAARAGHVASVAEAGGVLLDGAPIIELSSVDALAFLDDAGALVLASYREAEDTSSIVRVGPSAPAAIVAEVSGDVEADGRVRALVCDDAHGVVWIGGGFGLLAFEPREKLS